MDYEKIDPKATDVVRDPESIGDTREGLVPESLRANLANVADFGPGGGYPPPDRSDIFTMEDDKILPPWASDLDATTEHDKRPGRLDVNEVRPQVEFGTRDTVEATVRQFGDAVADKTMVVGKQGLKAALGDAAEPGTFDTNDTDMSMTPDAYAHVREQLRDVAGWEEVRLPDGRMMLTNGQVDISQGWNGMSHEEIAARKWRTDGPEGVEIAGVSDIIAYKMVRQTDQDVKDILNVRKTLLNPDEDKAFVVPEQFTRREQEIMLEECIPPELRDEEWVEKYVKLGGASIWLSGAVSGHHDIGVPVIGQGELEVKPVLLTYHNGIDIPKETKPLVQHFNNVNTADEAAGREPTFSGEQIAAGISGWGFGDVNFCDGRQTDEARSRTIYERHAAHYGVPPEQAKEIGASIRGQGFTEGTGEQVGKYGTPMQQAYCGNDMYTITSAKAVPDVIKDLALEDAASRRSNEQQPLNDELRAYRVPLLQGSIIRHLSDNPGTPGWNATVGRAAGGVGFTRNGYQFPPDYTMENPAMREESADEQKRITGRLKTDSGYTYADAVQDSKEFEKELHRRYPQAI